MKEDSKVKGEGTRAPCQSLWIDAENTSCIHLGNFIFNLGLKGRDQNCKYCNKGNSLWSD